MEDLIIEYLTVEELGVFNSYSGRLLEIGSNEKLLKINKENKENRNDELYIKHIIELNDKGKIIRLLRSSKYASHHLISEYVGKYGTKNVIDIHSINIYTMNIYNIFCTIYRYLLIGIIQRNDEKFLNKFLMDNEFSKIVEFLGMLEGAIKTENKEMVKRAFTLYKDSMKGGNEGYIKKSLILAINNEMFDIADIIISESKMKNIIFSYRDIGRLIAKNITYEKVIWIFKHLNNKEKESIIIDFIFHAAEKSDINLVRYLDDNIIKKLKFKFHIYNRGLKGAYLGGNVEDIDYFLGKPGVVIGLPDLQYASKNPNIEIFRSLQNQLIEMFGNQEVNITIFTDILMVVDVSTPVLEYLLTSNKNLIINNESLSDYLYTIISDNKLDKIKVIIENYDVPIYILNHGVLIASKNFYFEIAKYLIEHGANNYKKLLVSSFWDVDLDNLKWVINNYGDKDLGLNEALELLKEEDDESIYIKSITNSKDT